MIKYEFNQVKLAESAKTRWFNTSEIAHLLKNLNESNLKPFMIAKLPERPPNGSFFMIDVPKANKKWKQDGYNYVKRNNGVGFREDVVYLKIAGVKEVMCSYSYVDPGFSDQTNLPNCRRIYKLVNQPADYNYFLVHYLNEKNISDRSIEKTPDTYATENAFSVLSNSDEILKDEGKHFFEEIVSSSPKTTDYFEKVTELFEDKNFDFISYPESNENTNFSNFVLHDSVHNFGENICSFSTNKPTVDPIQEQSMSPMNFNEIKNKFSEIEDRLNNLELDKNAPAFQPINIFPNFDKGTSFRIVDYSPEWDFTKGGSKVIICVSPLCMISEEVNERLKVRFGTSTVPGFFIQPGVIKCYAPPHKEGFVKLSLSIDNETISTNQGENVFEFRKQKKEKNEHKSPMALKMKDIDSGSQFKIRVIEKMKEYDNQFGPVAQSGRTFENSDIFKKYLDLNVNEMSDLETVLPQNELLEILRFMNVNKPAGKEADFIKFLDSTDREGSTLIHYLCYLKYNDCLLYVLNCGASANVVSSTGITALEISLYLKDEQMLEILLSNDALDPKKIDEILRNENNDFIPSNLDIASLYKDRNLLDMLLREVSLCDSINNNNSLSVACPESRTHSDESYLSLYELLDERFGNFDACDNLSSYSSKADHNGDADRNCEDRRAQKRPRRYFRNYNKKNMMQKENINNNQSANIVDPLIFTDHQNQVQLIQKNVRGWLLRRQYLDILHATRVLQNYIRGKMAKKKLDEEEEHWDKIIEDKLKNKVKDWLNIKE